jgi:toxin FitB
VRYLLDTCVVSELTRLHPAPGVVDWVRSQQEEHLFLSVLTLGELRRGIERLPDSRKRRRLENWFDRDLKLRFSGRCLVIDEEVCERWGFITARAAKGGTAVPVLDGLIAATALVHGMTVVTRNTADVSATGVLLLNPWEG